MNGMPEQKLKQARLPFKSTTTRKTTIPETGKKRKHEDDSETAPQPAYIDLTEEKERSQPSSNIDTGVKSNKVCIIQIESDGPAGSNPDGNDVPKSNDSKSYDKCSLQKWFKPKQLEVTSNIKSVDERNDGQRDQTNPSSLANERNELTLIDDSAQSQQSGALKDGEEDDVSLIDDSANLSIDVDMSENDGSFSKTESSAPDTPNSKSNLKKKLTAKQKLKREEIEMKRQEKERLRKEKEKKRLEEKEEKQRQKEEKEKKRLADLEAKNEEKRQKEEERKAKEDEKKRQKEEERKLKEEERKQKEEERRQKEEEKRQKEEQKRQKEEQERKLKEKTAAAFTNFFLPKNKETHKEQQPDSSDRINCTMFMPFEVKENMRLASVHRITVSAEALRFLDEILQKGKTLPKDFLYLAVLKSKNYKPGKSDNTWPLNASEDDDDVMIVGDEHSLSATEKPMRYRCKLIQFHENRRPAYRGTWRKQSKTVSGRTPFKQDEIFDYEVDSDEEWEDEPGEDLEGGSEDEKESEDDYEVDNDVFVPHGYLSDEEGQNDDALDSSPKTNKLKLNVLERQFEEEMKEKTHKLKPRIFGCIWIENVIKSNEGVSNVENLLLTFRAVYNEQRTPFCVLSESNEITSHNTPSVKAKLKNEFPDSLLPDLVKLAHGGKKNTKILAKEFHVYVLNKDPTLNLTLSCITNKLKEISVWVSNIACRLVNDEIKNQCGLNDLSHAENTWKYITIADKPVPEKILKPDSIEKSTILQNSSLTPTSSMIKEIPKNKFSIAKFVKVLTPEEKQMAFHENTSEKSDKSTTSVPAQKPKPKSDITKFIKLGTSIGKTVENESFKNNSHRDAISIDLIAEDSNPLKESSDERVGEAVLPKNQTNGPPIVAFSGHSPVASKSTPNKPVNILVPRKVPRSATTNVLIPRKTPDQTLASTNCSAEMPPPKTFNFDEMKTQSAAFAPKRLLDSLNKTDPPKTVNILVPRRAKDVKNSENFKPVNVLTPRRAKDAIIACKTSENTSCSKSVSILIPRRANDEDVEKNDANILKNDSKPLATHETKDIAQDDASSDFSLCIESNDVPDQEMPKDSNVEVEK